MAVTRRLRKFCDANSPEKVTAQMNGTTTDGFSANRGGMRSGERIVGSYEKDGYLYLITEELVMGPVP